MRSMASSVGTSTSPSQSRSTSNSATSTGRSRSSRRFVLAARLTKRMAPGSRGARPGTAIVSRRGTCVERPSASAALHSPGPVPEPPTTSPTRRSGGGGAMPSRVGVPRQYSPRRTCRSSPASASRESVFATVSGEASKSSGRQNRFLEGRTRLRIAFAILVSLMVCIIPLLSTRRYAKLTLSEIDQSRDRAWPDRGQAIAPARTPGRRLGRESSAPRIAPRNSLRRGDSPSAICTAGTHVSCENGTARNCVCPCVDARNLLGVKRSRVRIPPARPRKSWSEPYRESLPGPRESPRVAVRVAVGADAHGRRRTAWARRACCSRPSATKDVAAKVGV